MTEHTPGIGAGGANAQLLLSAPAMLEALQAIERLAKINLQTGIKHIAQTAIKKAKL